jgi:hypothetical protein
LNKVRLKPPSLRVTSASLPDLFHAEAAPKNPPAGSAHKRRDSVSATLLCSVHIMRIRHERRD